MRTLTAMFAAPAALALVGLGAGIAAADQHSAQTTPWTAPAYNGASAKGTYTFNHPTSDDFLHVHGTVTATKPGCFYLRVGQSSVDAPGTVVYQDSEKQCGAGSKVVNVNGFEAAGSVPNVRICQDDEQHCGAPVNLPEKPAG